jgi:hypothetical protein
MGLVENPKTFLVEQCQAQGCFECINRLSTSIMMQTVLEILGPGGVAQGS